MSNDEILIEKLAAIEHERWSHWQQFVHTQAQRQPDGSLVLPQKLVEKWDRLINTKYENLTEEEQESDREQVRRYLPLVNNSFKK